MLVTRLRNTRVRFRLVRKGVVMWVGSKPLVATSTSIGVNSHEFVSLIRVKDTVGSLRNCLSRRSAVVTPANPPPKITTWVTFSGREIARTGDSGPRKYWASSRAAWDRIPRKKQDNSQQINAGKSALISSAAHCGCCPLTNGRRMTLMVAQTRCASVTM